MGIMDVSFYYKSFIRLYGFQLGLLARLFWIRGRFVCLRVLLLYELLVLFKLHQIVWSLVLIH